MEERCVKSRIAQPSIGSLEVRLVARTRINPRRILVSPVCQLLALGSSPTAIPYPTPPPSHSQSRSGPHLKQFCRIARRVTVTERHLVSITIASRPDQKVVIVFFAPGNRATLNRKQVKKGARTQSQQKVTIVKFQVILLVEYQFH